MAARKKPTKKPASRGKKTTGRPASKAKKARGGRPSMGENPLDSLFSSPAAEPTAEEPRAQAAAKASRRGLAPAGTTPRPGKPRRPSKERATFHLPTDLIKECRDAVVALSGPPVRLTLAAMAEEAFRRELERLKKKHNGGDSFPPLVGVKLRGGRPIGS